MARPAAGWGEDARPMGGHWAAARGAGRPRNAGSEMGGAPASRQSGPCPRRGSAGSGDQHAAAAGTILLGFDFDLFLLLHGLRRLRQSQREHAVFEARLDLVAIDALRDRKAAAEAAVTALGEMIAFVLLLPFLALFTGNRQDVARQIDFDVLLADAGQFGGNVIGLVVLGDIDGRDGDPESALAPERLRLEDATQCGKAEAAPKLVEYAVHFVAQRLKQVEPRRLHRRRSLRPSHLDRLIGHDVTLLRC